MDKWKAPWNDEQIAVLKEYQESYLMHPYTCGNRGDGNHHDNGRDLGVLVPTREGWMCPDCDYRQDWAHAHTTD